MLDDILNFPNYVLDGKTSINEIFRDIVINDYKFFPKFEDLLQGVIRKKDVISSWIEYSENKRSSPSWYFVKQGKKYKVGFISNKKLNEGVYEDPHFACALFIKLEMESRFLSMLPNYPEFRKS